VAKSGRGASWPPRSQCHRLYKKMEWDPLRGPLARFSEHDIWKNEALAAMFLCLRPYLVRVVTYTRRTMTSALARFVKTLKTLDNTQCSIAATLPDQYYRLPKANEVGSN